MLKRLAGLYAEKECVSYSEAIAWPRRRLAFELMRSCILCIRGSPRCKNSNINPEQLQPDLALVSGQIQN